MKRPDMDYIEKEFRVLDRSSFTNSRAMADYIYHLESIINQYAIDLGTLADDIHKEIEKQSGHPNIGKRGCLKRVKILIDKYKSEAK